MSMPPLGIGMGRPGNLVGPTGTQANPQRAPTTETPTQQQAPLSLTLPPPPRRDVAAGQADQARSIASEPPRQGVAPSRAEVAKGKLLAAGDKLLEARHAGVDVAKTTFWKKALGVALSAVTVGVAAGLTAISFGGAAPLLALACVNFAVSSGDAVCAYRNLRNAEAVAQMRPPPYDTLPMGNSIVANVMHGVLTRCNVSEGTAATVANVTGKAASLGLAVAAVAVGAGLSGLPMAYDLAGKVTSGVSTAVAVASTLTSLMTNGLDRDALQGSLDQIRQDVTALQNPARGRSGLDSDGQTMASNILRSLDGTDTATALHEAALDDAGRGRDAVVGAAGVLRALEPALGLMNMVRV